MAMLCCDPGILGKLERWNSEKLPRRFLDYASDEESIYSEQGYETATVGQELESDSDEIVTVEEDLESETVGQDLESDSDESDQSMERDETSNDVASCITSAAEFSNHIHQKSLSDSPDTESSLDEDDDLVPRKRFFWRCLKCDSPSQTFLRYCRNCYKERKSAISLRKKPRHRTQKSQFNSFKDSAKNSQIFKSQITMEMTKETYVKNNYYTITSENSKSILPNQISSVQISNGKYRHKSNKMLLHCEYSKKKCPKFAIKEKVSQDVEKEKSKTGIFKLSTKSTRKRCFEDLMMDKRNDELPPSILKRKYSLSLEPDSKRICQEFTQLKSQSMPRTRINPNLCQNCKSRPRDACFVHDRISHQVCCYLCAKKIYKENKRCPICQRKIQKITRNIVA